MAAQDITISAPASYFRQEASASSISPSTYCFTSHHPILHSSLSNLLTNKAFKCSLAGLTPGSKYRYFGNVPGGGGSGRSTLPDLPYFFSPPRVNSLNSSKSLVLAISISATSCPVWLPSEFAASFLPAVLHCLSCFAVGGCRTGCIWRTCFTTQRPLLTCFRLIRSPPIPFERIYPALLQPPRP